MELVTPSLGLIFWTTLIFILLMIILGKYAWKPILNAVKEREQTIETALKSAEKAREEMSKLQADNEKILQEARVERDKLMKEAREIKDQIVEEAKLKAVEESKKLMDAAIQNIENEKKSAIENMKVQIAEFSIEVAEKVLRKQLADNKESKALVDELMKEIKIN